MSHKKFEGIHDLFQRDSTYRDSQIKNLLDQGEVSTEMDKLAQVNRSYCPSSEEHER